MIDAKKLLDQFLGAAAAPGRGSPLDGLLGAKSGGRQGGPLDSLIGNIDQGSFAKGALTGGLAGVLLGSKAGKKIAGSALEYGGLALVGALAYKAYQDWQSGKAPEAKPAAPAALPPPGETPFVPASEAGQQGTARLLLQAMISAAKADGHIDADEQRRIFAKLDQVSLSSDDKAFLMDELRRPVDVDGLARAAASPEAASEIYAASLLAIDLDGDAERGYLAMLAARLNLPKQLVDHLHATVGATAPPA